MSEAGDKIRAWCRQEIHDDDYNVFDLTNTVREREQVIMALVARVEWLELLRSRDAAGLMTTFPNPPPTLAEIAEKLE